MRELGVLGEKVLASATSVFIEFGIDVYQLGIMIQVTSEYGCRSFAVCWAVLGSVEMPVSSFCVTVIVLSRHLSGHITLNRLEVAQNGYHTRAEKFETYE